MVALVFVILPPRYSRRMHGIMAIGLGILFLISLVVVWWVRGEFVDATVASEIEGWKDLWFDVFVVMLIILSETVLVTVLWLLGEKSNNEPNHPSRIVSL